MKELSIQFNYKARYYKLGKITKDTKQVWFVIHGYGQLAQFFIKKFKPLEDRGICVIAPEGLSRFYLEDVPTRIAGGSNRVGATWMTRENREMDIANYIRYLQAVYDHELKVCDTKPHITLLGFSQGGATISRWALSGKPQFDRFILWAGIFPPDMNFDIGNHILKSKDVISVFGKDDPFITEERKKEMDMLSDKLGVLAKLLTFDGKHEMNDDTLIGLANL